MAIAMALSVTCFSQTDTIYTNNHKIACVIKEITPEAVKYTFEGEDIVNSIYKNAVEKIITKNGRVQTFSEVASYKKVKGVDDFENVSITQVESEVKGLFKVGEVSSKAKGTTNLANQERVKQRAYRKMKMVAAMMGANVIYLTDQHSESNKAGGQHHAGSPAETNLTGVAYSSILPSVEEFKSIIKDKRNFVAVEKAKLWSSASDLNRSILDNEFTITSINDENGIIQINGVLQGEPKYKKFRIVSFDKDYFTVYFEDKSSSYNVKVKI